MKSPNDLLALIEREIQYKRQNTLYNHLLTVTRMDHESLSGEMHDGGFKVWKYSRWYGIFYPVLHGSINYQKGKPRLKIRSRLNPLGLLMTIILLTIYGITIFVSVILHDDNSGTFLWKRVLIGIFLFYFPILILRIPFRYESKREGEIIKEMVEGDSN